MKRIFPILFTALLLLAVLSLAACSGTPDDTTPPTTTATTTAPIMMAPTEVRSASLMVNGDILTAALPNATTEFSFLADIVVPEGATYLVARDASFEQVIQAKVAPLFEGDNTFYILVTNGNETKTYMATIRRRPMCTVPFETIDGTPLSSAEFEEGARITAMSILGYGFLGWYDGDTCLSIDPSYICTAEKRITAKYIFDATALAPFTYTRSNASCEITGLKDRNATSVTIPASVTSIGSEAFSDCYSLTSVTFAEGSQCTSIGSDAFRSCTALTSMTIPANVTSIEYGAFSHCYSLTSVTFAEGSQHTNIGKFAFYSCDSLTSITIPANVTNIGEDALAYCSKLTVYCEVASQPSGWSSGWNSNRPVVWDCKNNELASNGYVYAMIDGLRYALKDGVAMVAGQPRNITTAVIPTYVSYKGTTYTVTSIGYSAFGSCHSLTSVTIPASVTQIENSAFHGCISLASITIPSGVTRIGDSAFGSCHSLTSVNIPANIKRINANAFSDCTSLTSVVIPASVTHIENSAFSGCTSLTSISVDSSNAIYQSIDGSLYTKDGKTLVQYAIGKTATSFIFPNSVTSIKSGAFSGCRSLTSVTIPSSITRIESSPFHNCSKLTIYCEATSTPSRWSDGWNSSCPVVWDCKNNEVASDGYIYAVIDGLSYSLKNGIATVAGQSCDITTAVIPTSVSYKGIAYTVTGIGSYAFHGCTSLVSITIPSGVTSIGDSAFGGCNSLTSVTIPSSITRINSYAFSNCTSLTSVVIPASVTYIGNSAFESCHSLSSIAIPTSVEIIGGYAFLDCTSLTSVTIPANVVDIRFGTFAYCPKLTIYCEVESQPSGWNNSWNYSNRPVVWNYKSK